MNIESTDFGADPENDMETDFIECFCAGGNTRAGESSDTAKNFFTPSIGSREITRPSREIYPPEILHRQARAIYWGEDIAELPLDCDPDDYYDAAPGYPY